MSHIDDLINKINKSPWKGMVSEVGFGVHFAGSFLNEPGASNTILYTNSPYSKLFQGDADRSVSREGVLGLIDKLEAAAPESETEANPMFYLAVSGSHKGLDENGDSHGWIGLRTVIPGDNGPQTETTLLHFRIPKVINGKEVVRSSAGYFVAWTMFWLLDTMLLGSYSSWADAYQKFDYKKVIHINIIEDARITMKEQLMLAEFNNTLLYHNGRFERPIEYIRKHDKFMGGSFNPPHAHHLSAGTDAVFMLNFENPRKNKVSLDDMIHRIKMLDLSGVPVMIMKERPMTAFQVRALQNLRKEKLTVVVGADTFNAICNTKYIPAGDELFEPLSDEEEIQAREEILTDFLKPLYKDTGVTIQVFERAGHEIVDNQWSKQMELSVVTSSEDSVNTSSTDARGGNHSNLSDEVVKYIKDNDLYSDGS